MPTDHQQSPKPSAIALLPFALFLALFVGTGFVLTQMNIEFAFYQLPAPVAILPAIILAIWLHRAPLTKTLNEFMSGVGQNTIITMCLIYLLAGAFSSVAKATGGVDATVNLGLTMIPEQFILPGIFLIAAFVATAMGTSMGTIAAIAPVALGIADTAGIDKALMAGTVLSGAMFGDNLSIISDTTIAATRTQGCAMKDKFRENIHIALPAALLAVILFYVLQPDTAPTPTEPTQWLLVLPYLTILILAVAGINVFVVLTIGIVMAGLIGMFNQGYEVLQFSKDIYAGFQNMQEIFILSMLIGGLSQLIKVQGGLAYITQLCRGLVKKLSKANQGAHNPKATEAALASMVGITNCCTANNTVSIIVCGDVARNIAQEQKVSPKRSASLLDIFSCISQGMIPWGAQALLLGSTFAITPMNVVGHSYYVMLLLVTSSISIAAGRGMKKPTHQ
ncbi:Na+/H+ antiporter NhaC family protein [Echinimonas agarilytica]|uniref:Na+/H+ antiporter NhaC family protein n=1 Tax=Echinimonas agarilytica TaxID=1215918 RepID=A0AA42B7V0_9GAMM|nr:Na+/H+ antiporter NhaC family protein [Echinimonas agarilytica]MCM2679661.1 Na+/H+ antiporter NhaC family protein [Echinimonas agarilytica]